MNTRERRALSLLGLIPADADADSGAAHAARVRRARAAAAAISRRIRPGTLVLITGPSGSGKTTLLRELRRGSVCREVSERAQCGGDASVVGALRGALLGEHGVLRALAAVGLADGAMLARRASALSGGERFRLALARAMLHRRRVRACDRGRTRGATLIIADEFGATLDRPSAKTLGAAARRWVDGPGRRAGLALVVATAHEDLLGSLRPRIRVRVDEEGEVRVSEHGRDGRGTESTGLMISRGTRADYARLARHHYRSGAPATVCVVLKATSREEPGGPALGVLVVSMPVLNARWRERAWPGRYSGAGVGSDARERARRLNAEVRCISRLIVHPRHRGLGVGAALVRAYLADPLTTRTECLAAMGAMCPVFARAGMREHRLPPPARDASLRRALGAAGVRGVRASDPALIARAARERPELMDALRTWADASRATRRHKDAHVHVLALLAARALGSRPVAYTAGE